MFLLIGPITFVMSLDRTAIVVAAPTIQHEYGFSLVEMSWILTSFSWTYALLQVPSGWLAERFGPRRMLYWANLLWSVLTAATPLGFNLASFIGIRALLGAGQSADWPSSIVAIRRWFPHSERAQGQLHPAGGAVSGTHRGGAGHYLGHPAVRLALGVLRLRRRRRGAGHRVVAVVSRYPGGTSLDHAGGSRAYPGRPARPCRGYPTRRVPRCACPICASGRSGCSISSW